MSREPLVTLGRGRDAAIRRGHPWIFRGAIERIEPDPASGSAEALGATVRVAAHDGELLGRAAWSPHSQIALRMWSTDPDESIDRAFFARRISEALDLRTPLLAEPRGGCRLVHGESDRLPGFVADRYADVVVIQVSAAGAEAHRALLAGLLVESLRERGVAVRTVWERSDLDVREKEGLEPRVGPAPGTDLTPNDAAEGSLDEVVIEQGGLRFAVDVRTGHKTGFYLDQRDARGAIAEHAAGAEVLNAFAYSGSFGVAALAAGARSVVDLDASGDALALGARNLELNGIDPALRTTLEGNAFSVLRALRAEGRQFDLVILDPPKFAKSQKQLERAARGYKDINLLGCHLLRPGGLLATFSCSGRLGTDLFTKIVADAALDAGRFGRVIERFGHPPDHPVALPFPEGRYLQGLLVRLD